MIDRSTGKVLSRAEVPLFHEVPELIQPEIQVVEEKPEVEKPVEVASVETSTPDSPTAAAVSPTPETTKPVIEPKPASKEPKKPLEVKSALVEPKTVDTPKPVKIAKQEPKKRKVIRTGRAVIIKPGDNLWRISRKTYGRGIRYTTIYNANRSQIRNPNRIYIGQIFKIPQNNTQEVVVQ